VPPQDIADVARGRHHQHLGRVFITGDWLQDDLDVLVRFVELGHMDSPHLRLCEGVGLDEKVGIDVNLDDRRANLYWLLDDPGHLFFDFFLDDHGLLDHLGTASGGQECRAPSTCSHSEKVSSTHTLFSHCNPPFAL